MRSPRDKHAPLRHALDARDLKHADECSLHAREVRLVVLGLGRVGVATEGSGVRIRLELCEGIEEAVEVLVHTPARLEREDRCPVVLTAAERLVVRARLFGVGVLQRCACAHMRAVHGHRGAGSHPDDGPVVDVAIHALCIVRSRRAMPNPENLPLAHKLASY